MAQKGFSIGEAVGFGWGVMKANFWFFVGLIVINIVINAIPGLFQNANQLVLMIINLAAAVVNVIITIGMMKISLKFVNGEKAEYADLFNGYQLFWGYLGAAILYGIMVFLGTLLLVIPGIILALMFGLFGYVIVSKQLGPIYALKRSAAVTAGARWQMFLFVLVAILMNIAGAICLLVGLLATVPTTMVAAAYIYKKLDSQTTA